MTRTLFVQAANGGRESLHVDATAGATPTVDLANGNVQQFTLDENATFTFTGSAADLACGFTLILIQDGTGGWTVAWPASVDWPDGTPTLDTTAGAVVIATFLTVDNGTTWYGAIVRGEVEPE
jgi:hypothetical protein